MQATLLTRMLQSPQATAAARSSAGAAQLVDTLGALETVVATTGDAHARRQLGVYTWLLCDRCGGFADVTCDEWQKFSCSSAQRCARMSLTEAG